MISNPLDLDINQFNLNAPFNIGIACTQPAIKGFNPGQTAIVVDHPERQASSLTYSELNQQSNRFAHLLASQNIAKGDRVMLWLPNVSEFPVAFFGTLKLGAVAVPSSVLLTADEIEFLAANSGARILVTSKVLFEKLALQNLQHSKIENIFVIDACDSKSLGNVSVSNLSSQLDLHSCEDLECSTVAHDPAYLVYTSGTTGYPKGVLHAHRALLGRLPSAKRWFDYSSKQTDRILHSGKFNWTYVLGTALMDPLFVGKTVIVYEGESSPSIWPELIAKHAATVFIGVPTIYRQIIQKTKFTITDVPTLRHCMCAGEHLSDEMLDLWKQRFQQNIYEAIGMSECSYYLSQHPSNPVKPGSAGLPQPGHKIALLDENLQPVGDEAEGMLCIDLDDVGLFMEYWQLPDVTGDSRKGGYFLTGDYAKRDADGYYWFLGRKDDIINTFGFRVSPMEIERVLKTHPDIADCVALEENVAPEKNIITVCVIRTLESSLGEKDVIQFAGEHLATYKTPKRIVFLQDFPRTANGKVLRKALKQSISH
ncbi:MAG: acyl-CoA synthetase [Pseudomonadales bacterium]|nr:acyl-CoA synthetase [Pseudomonadales bacterium]